MKMKSGEELIIPWYKYIVVYEHNNDYICHEFFDKDLLKKDIDNFLEMGYSVFNFSAIAVYEKSGVCIK